MDSTDKIRNIPVQEDEDAPLNSAETVEEEALSEETEAEQVPDVDELNDRLLRLSAEFENYKKRTQRETAEFKKYANESVVKDMLPVMDNLERALESAKEGAGPESELAKKLVEGVELTCRDMLRLLEKYGVVPVESVGQPFDPNFHQALMTEPSSDHPDKTVIREMQKGYLMKDRLLRPALVVVSQAPPAEKDA